VSAVKRRDLLGLAASLPALPVRAQVAARRPLAVALGSGSMHGLAHIGIVRACEKLDLVPDLIVGSSVGAAVGALWAAGLDSGAIERTARSLDWTNAGSWTLPWRGLKHLDGLRRALTDAIGERNIEDLPRRFAAVATALADGSCVVLDRGPVDVAVAASSAIPVLFVPVTIGGLELVDGSLCAPVPVDPARERGGDGAVVLAVDVAYRPADEPPRLLTDIAFQTLHILVNALAAEQIARADVALRLSLHHLMLGPDASPDALIDAGEKALTDAWPWLRERLGVPASAR